MNHTAFDRILIVNADDFGLSHGVNRGVIRAHEQGIVTSASLMVRGSAATEAAAYGRDHPRLSIGLHFDIGEWRFCDGEWRAAYEVVLANDAAAVQAEWTRQLKLFRQLMGRYPTHLDSHQHVHRSEPISSILLQAARELGVALRGFSPDVQYCGAFYGQSDKGDPYPEAISVEALLRILETLPPGLTELCCHPGDGTDVDSIYRLERSAECETLCDARIRDTLAKKGIRLCSFADRSYGETATR